MKDTNQHSYFFDKGIRFVCRECGTCCTGDSGVISVSSEEVEDISAFLKLSRGVFIKTYLYLTINGYSIREGIGGNCLLYENDCRIYPVRPEQCRTYPFWIKNMRSEAKWNEVQNVCPGIGAGRLFTKKEILEILEKSKL
jgi:Fe-S-cluster containining protein